uniref:Uncharacterized protein n=1 Tax=Arundo donax TaxID=35708 RepID=A0A0A9FRT0_ARUDO
MQRSGFHCPQSCRRGRPRRRRAPQRRRCRLPLPMSNLDLVNRDPGPQPVGAARVAWVQKGQICVFSFVFSFCYIGKREGNIKKSLEKFTKLRKL